MTALAANTRSPPDSFPALVLNADFQPLSYYPLSLWNWQETIKAVFLDRVNIVSFYDRVVRSPTFEMKLPERRLVKDLCETSALSRFHALQCVLAGPVPMSVLRVSLRSDVRSLYSALAGGRRAGTM